MRFTPHNKRNTKYSIYYNNRIITKLQFDTYEYNDGDWQ